MLCVQFDYDESVCAMIVCCLLLLADHGVIACAVLYWALTVHSWRVLCVLSPILRGLRRHGARCPLLIDHDVSACVLCAVGYSSVIVRLLYVLYVRV